MNTNLNRVGKQVIINRMESCSRVHRYKYLFSNKYH